MADPLRKHAISPTLEGGESDLEFTSLRRDTDRRFCNVDVAGSVQGQRLLSAELLDDSEASSRPSPHSRPRRQPRGKLLAWSVTIESMRLSDEL